MEIKTCEQYVLEELEKYKNLYEQANDELSEVIGENISLQKQCEKVSKELGTQYNELCEIFKYIISFDKDYVSFTTLFYWCKDDVPKINTLKRLFDNDRTKNITNEVESKD